MYVYEHFNIVLVVMKPLIIKGWDCTESYNDFKIFLERNKMSISEMRNVCEISKLGRIRQSEFNRSLTA